MDDLQVLHRRFKKEKVARKEHPLATDARLRKCLSRPDASFFLCLVDNDTLFSYSVVSICFVCEPNGK
jgi:hypothetical protein